jgi:hypothetical protein
MKRQGASSLLLGLFLFLQAMVAVPALHAIVHHDAADPDHECAVTLFAHGQVDAAAAVPPVFCPPAVLISIDVFPRVIFVSTDVRLLPGRGPPVCPALA